ncbi:putative F-box/FBD/LRR-repeat protein At3g23955 isoform X2 [Salvia hispanica]|uniref:putative F-box/FBD/LRR-repeat protein At3g23955 isoform X2 n=1 Tax=Salvia hispanica TaxID=49212 RepID=UPI0020091F26|nr:putative F-box/FBD/LRR-repeat protein At3g23955 isoform X2 [Salvia hispanica]
MDLYEPVDRISKLPDELLGLILSFLNLKEAMATSILCSRWRYAWIFTSNLDLHVDLMETSQILRKYGIYSSTMLESMYVSWVDHLLTLLPESSINLVKFRVSFHFLSSSFKSRINDWVSYAVRRKVESLDLILITSLNEKCYNFPYKQGNFPDNLKLLKKLCLCSVDVSEVVQTSPLFKSLEIIGCKSLKSFVVRESELVCIKYAGPHCKFVLVDAPLLAQLWIWAAPRTSGLPSMAHIFKMFDSLLPQLHMLKIFATRKFEQWDRLPKKMPNLKELVVVLESDYCDKWPLVQFINWFSVTPSLQRFVVEASHQEMNKACFRYCSDHYLLDGSDAWVREINRDFPFLQTTPPRGKEIEFVGYRGVFNHLQLIIQIVKHRAAIDKIIIDPRPFEIRSYMPWDCISLNQMDDEIFARNLAKDQLGNYPHVNIL